MKYRIVWETRGRTLQSLSLWPSRSLAESQVTKWQSVFPATRYSIRRLG